MIARLRGILIEKKPPELLVEVQGVGYLVQAPMSTIFQLPDLGQELILYTELVVREDAHKLYGFLTQSEQSLFNKITKVSGVGPKLGLAILSGMSPESFVQKIQEADISALVRLPGVGKKTAERLVIELRDKFGNATFSQTVLSNHYNAKMDDAKAALESLGYSAKEADQAISKIDNTELSSEEMIKMALSSLM